MSEIVKTKFLCKSTTSVSSGRSSKLFKTDLITFQEGKWYDGEYETWKWEKGYRTNGGWRRYWVINEQGKKEEIHRNWFKIQFETDLDKLRDNKIENILKQNND